MLKISFLFNVEWSILMCTFFKNKSSGCKVLVGLHEHNKPTTVKNKTIFVFKMRMLFLYKFAKLQNTINELLMFATTK